jgi:hypothetical protein
MEVFAHPKRNREEKRHRAPAENFVDGTPTSRTYAFAKSVLPYAKEPSMILPGRRSNARRVVCWGGRY